MNDRLKDLLVPAAVFVSHGELSGVGMQRHR
jgi:hypothetical protein